MLNTHHDQRLSEELTREEATERVRAYFRRWLDFARKNIDNKHPKAEEIREDIKLDRIFKSWMF